MMTFTMSRLRLITAYTVSGTDGELCPASTSVEFYTAPELCLEFAGEKKKKNSCIHCLLLDKGVYAENVRTLFCVV